MKKYIFKSRDKTSPSLKPKTVFSSLIHSLLYSICTISLQILLTNLLCHVMYFHHWCLPNSLFPLLRFLFHAWLFWSLVFLLKSPYMHLVSISCPLIQLFFCIKIISCSILVNSQTVNIYGMGSASILPLHSCLQS